MHYRQIIGEAWLFTQDKENKKLIVWYAFIPSILTTIVGILYLIYQFYALKSSALFEHWDQSFTVIALKAIYQTAMEHVDNLLPLFIVLGILAIAYVFLPPITEGAIIQLIARKKNKQDVRMRDGVRYGLMSFLPLFNYSWVARSFNFVVILGEISLIARNVVQYFGPDLLNFLIPIFIILIIAGIIFSMLFVFTEYYIVVDDCHVKESMAKSATLMVKHWDTAIMVAILMFIISIRILLQIVFVLLVPGAIMVLIYFFAASTLPIFGLILGAALTIVALIFASYLGAIVHVFTSSVWVFTFLALTANPEVSARDQVAV